MAYIYRIALLLASIGGVLLENTTEQAFGYEKQVLTDLCQYNGVKFVRDPDNVPCGYSACWEGKPHSMKCPLGTRTDDNFFWGVEYPCSQIDVANDCNGLLKYLEEQEREQRLRMEEEQRRLHEFRMWQRLQKHIAEHPQLTEIEDIQNTASEDNKYIELNEDNNLETNVGNPNGPYGDVAIDDILRNKGSSGKEGGVSFTPYRTNAVEGKSTRDNARAFAESSNHGTYIVEPMGK